MTPLTRGGRQRFSRFPHPTRLDDGIHTSGVGGYAIVRENGFRVNEPKFGRLFPERRKTNVDDRIDGRIVFTVVHNGFRCQLQQQNVFFSSLRRIKTYLRSTTIENRLFELALLSFHHIPVDPDEVVSKFASISRRMDFIL